MVLSGVQRREEINREAIGERGGGGLVVGGGGGTWRCSNKQWAQPFANVVSEGQWSRDVLHVTGKVRGCRCRFPSNPTPHMSFSERFSDAPLSRKLRAIMSRPLPSRGVAATMRQKRAFPLYLEADFLWAWAFC